MSIFKLVDNKFIVNIKELYAYLPKRYESFDFLHIGNEIAVFGVFDIEYNKELHGFLLPAMIIMIPSEINNVKIDGVDYYKCTFYEGDTFMNNTSIIKNAALASRMFKEFIEYGNMPRFVTYNNIKYLFDNVKEITGINFYMNKVIFEMIYAHLYRDADNLNLQYRNSSKTKQPIFIGSRNVAYGPDSTSAKIFGSYFSDGLNSSLINQSNKQYELEDLMRF